MLNSIPGACQEASFCWPPTNRWCPRILAALAAGSSFIVGLQKQPWRMLGTLSCLTSLGYRSHSKQMIDFLKGEDVAAEIRRLSWHSDIFRREGLAC